MAVYYNDNDPRVCAWLRELIVRGHLPDGRVDNRSICYVKDCDLLEYDQCHFFAGIGGWPLAIRWAGLEGVRGIWTGSCPCQPLSIAGKRQGHADRRHLWPAVHSLIAQCRPPVVFGEQVASPLGREWLAGVRADLEGVGYACGAADLCAASVGAPHIRQRLYWVAGANRGGSLLQERGELRTVTERVGVRVGHTSGVVEGRDRRCGAGDRREGANCGPGAWGDCDIRRFCDGRARRVESGLSPLVDGFPGRLGLLRGYGNAIVPQVAATFITAWVETL